MTGRRKGLFIVNDHCTSYVLYQFLVCRECIVRSVVIACCCLYCNPCSVSWLFRVAVAVLVILCNALTVLFARKSDREAEELSDDIVFDLCEHLKVNYWQTILTCPQSIPHAVCRRLPPTRYLSFVATEAVARRRAALLAAPIVC